MAFWIVRVVNFGAKDQKKENDAMCIGRNSMSSRSNNNKKPEPDRPPIRKERKCLMCGKEFVSSHVGERVCTNCKSTAAWREGSYAA